MGIGTPEIDDLNKIFGNLDDAIIIEHIEDKNMKIEVVKSKKCN